MRCCSSTCCSSAARGLRAQSWEEYRSYAVNLRPFATGPALCACAAARRHPGDRACKPPGQPAAVRTRGRAAAAAVPAAWAPASVCRRAAAAARAGGGRAAAAALRQLRRGRRDPEPFRRAGRLGLPAPAALQTPPGRAVPRVLPGADEPARPAVPSPVRTAPVREGDRRHETHPHPLPWFSVPAQYRAAGGACCRADLALCRACGAAVPAAGARRRILAARDGGLCRP